MQPSDRFILDESSSNVSSSPLTSLLFNSLSIISDQLNAEAFRQPKPPAVYVQLPVVVNLRSLIPAQHHLATAQHTSTHISTSITYLSTSFLSYTPIVAAINKASSLPSIFFFLFFPLFYTFTYHIHTSPLYALTHFSNITLR